MAFEDGRACGGPVRLLDVSLCPITVRQCVTVVQESLRQGRGGWIVTLNVDHVRRCSRDPRYAETVRMVDLPVADGMPLVWASMLQRTPLPQRVAGSDLICVLSRALGTEGRSVFLLGGDRGTAQEAAEVLRRTCPGLAVAGTHCPPVGFERNPQEMQCIRDNLLASQPDMVFVALGSPKQEYLIRDLRPLLPKAWWIGVGISFSFLCGRVRRAPGWMQRCGLEWLHRLAQEPGRLARRYLVQDMPFALHLLTHAGMRGLARRPSSGGGN